MHKRSHLCFRLQFCTLAAQLQSLDLLEVSLVEVQCLGETKDLSIDSKTTILRACKKSEVLNVGAEAQPQVGLAPRVAVLRKVNVIELNQELNHDQDLVHQEVDMDLQAA